MSEKNYFRIAERMALRAIGTTYPNPPVGAVIVNNGIILSRGWTQPKGVPHAEIHAINQIKNKIKQINCTLLNFNFVKKNIEIGSRRVPI